MLQNMLMTALTPLNAINELNCWDNRPFVNQWPEFQVNRTKRCEEITRTIKKKPRRARTSFTTDQINCLEDEFSRHPYMDARKRAELSKSINIGERQIKIWFQNRRMKKKRQSLESSSDCSSGTSSSVPTSSINGSGLLAPQRLITSENSEEPMYNVDVSYPVIDEQYVHQPQQFPTYQNVQYHEEMAVYPTEYYPTSYGGYGFSESCFDQNYVAPATSWYDIGMHGLPNDDFMWQQNV